MSACSDCSDSSSEPPPLVADEEYTHPNIHARSGEDAPVAVDETHHAGLDVEAPTETTQETEAPADAPAAPAVPAADAGTAAAADDDDDDDDEGYSKKAVDKMCKAIERAADPEQRDLGFADALEADAKGFKPITWTQLKEVFSYERPAEGFKLTGDISQKNMEQWERSKQIKVRDCDGVEGAIFFYDEDCEKGGFEWEDIQVGHTISIYEPRFHRFLDGQEGMRIESCASVGDLVKQRFSDESRLDYGQLNKDNGNKKFKAKKYDAAIEFYDAAIKHLEGTFHERPQDEQRAKELVAACHLNIAACFLAQDKFKLVEQPCRAALKVNAAQASNAKAYFRIGLASLGDQEYAAARASLTRALELAPGDAAVVGALQRLSTAVSEQKEAEAKLFEVAKAQEKRPFGLKRRMLEPVPDALDGVPNFRDVGGKLCLGGTARLRRHTLYRAGSMASCVASDVDQLTAHLGVKTIIDLRSWYECRLGLQKIRREEQRERERLALLKKDDDAPRQVPVVDYHQHFTPVAVVCSAGAPPKRVVQQRTAAGDAVLQGRVALLMDLSAGVVWQLASWWTLLRAAFFALFFFSQTMLDIAFGFVFRGTALRVGIDGLYKAVLESGAPTLREAVSVISGAENHPVVVCCSLGKDRTGIVVALVLAALGVAEEDIVADYAATTDRIPELYRKAQIAQGAPEEWNTADPATMRRFLQHVQERYGGARAYLTKIGVKETELSALEASLTVPC